MIFLSAVQLLKNTSLTCVLRLSPNFHLTLISDFLHRVLEKKDLHCLQSSTQPACGSEIIINYYKNDILCGMYVHTHTHTMEHYSAIKKNEIMPFAKILMKRQRFHIKCSKSDRKRQISFDITYMWDLKYDTSKLINETKADSQTQEKTYGQQRGEQKREIIQEFGIHIYTLLYVK